MISHSVCRALKLAKVVLSRYDPPVFSCNGLVTIQKAVTTNSEQDFYRILSTYRSANPVRIGCQWMWNVITMRTFNCLKARWFSSGRLLSLSFTFYLARVENIRQFRILDKKLHTEDEEVTPTMKVKRKSINAQYKDLIESMYREWIT